MLRYLTIIFVISPLFAFNQTQKALEKAKFEDRISNKKPTIFDKILTQGETNTISFSFKNYGLLTIENLKEDLLKYEGKVLRIAYDEKNMLFKFEYNNLMQKNDLIDLFIKHGIEYRIKNVPIKIENE